MGSDGVKPEDWSAGREATAAVGFHHCFTAREHCVSAADGSSHVVMDPPTLIERLAALVPRPLVRLVTDHGMFAPAAPLRDRVVPPPPPPPEAEEPAPHDAGSACMRASTARTSSRVNTTGSFAGVRAHQVVEPRQGDAECFGPGRSDTGGPAADVTASSFVSDRKEASSSAVLHPRLPIARPRFRHKHATNATRCPSHLPALIDRMDADLAAAPSTHAIFKLRALQHGNQFHLVATAQIDAGEALLRVEGEFTRTPSRYSLQADAARHIDVPVGTSLREQLERDRGSFLNHACAPNAAFRGLTLVATRAIRQGEEITFHYATTEYDMAEAFRCRCGRLLCLGEIRGFRHLPPAALQRLRPWGAPHLLARLTEGGDARLSA